MAAESFRSVLSRHGYPTTIVWVFRDDLVASREEGQIRNPLPAENRTLARKVFDQGRATGLVEIRAVGMTDKFIAATVWFPRTAEDEVQGWSQGMKLSITEPLPSLRLVASRLSWWLVSLSRSYRLYQHRHVFIPTRKWASA